MKKIAIIATLALSACSTGQNVNQPSKASVAFSQASTPSLCSTYVSASTAAVSKLMIEAELAVRGVKQCASSNYGAATAASFGSSRYTRETSTSLGGADKDCSDFGSGASAQRFFLASGGPISDPHDLDRDGDGLACEWGKEIKRISSYKPRQTAYKAPRRARASQRCYTGARGGTYTLTASGNKNYSGC